MRKRSGLSFSRPDLPTFTCRPVDSRQERRGSPSQRGYDHDWTRASLAHRRKEPLCRECRFRGRRTAADLVDHIVPVVDRPDLRLDRENFCSLCKDCHDRVKRALEAYARRAGDILLLRAWMADPVSRPIHMRYERAP